MTAAIVPCPCEPVHAQRSLVLRTASDRSRTLCAVTSRSPREIGSTVFHSYDRYTVRAVVAGWVSSATGPQPPRVVSIPGGASLAARVSPDRIEADLDGVPPSDARAFFAWIASTCSSRHCLYGTHVVVVHAAEHGDPASLARIARARYCVLIVSTTRPDSRAIRQLVSVALHVRVPSHDVFAVPECARPHYRAAAVRARSADGNASETVAAARALVRALRGAGFERSEILRYARTTFVPDGTPVDDRAATLAHAASITCAMADRALEAAVIQALAAGTSSAS